MANTAKSQTQYYPAKTVKEVCNTCYPGLGEAVCQKGPQNSEVCEKCNVDCNTCQSYCEIGRENINQHGDVGNFSKFNACQDEIIFRKWTAKKWNELAVRLLTADQMGILENQGAGFSISEAQPDPDNETHIKGSLITAAYYNEMKAALEAFGVSGIEQVFKDITVIRAYHSDDLDEGFDDAKFRTTVCDICNAADADETNCSYNCSCNYNCCNYNCSYNCSYNCGKR